MQELSPMEKRGVRKAVQIHQNADIRGSGGDCDMVKLIEDVNAKRNLVSEQDFPSICGCTDNSKKTQSKNKTKK
jgi:hypothetical protein